MESGLASALEELSERYKKPGSLRSSSERRLRCRGVRPQDLAVQNSRVEGRAWTWAVQGPSGGCIGTDE